MYGKKPKEVELHTHTRGGMARSPQKGNRAVKKGAWTPEEDAKLIAYIQKYGIWNWTQMPKFVGLSRSGKSCRLRWLNYLSPHVKRGNFAEKEVETIINMYQKLGSRWSLIAKELPGRTDNEIKNYWHTRLKKRFMNNLVPRVQSPVVELLSLGDIRENSHEIKSSSFDNIEEVSILEGYNYQGASNVLQETDWDFAGDAEKRQVEIGFAEMNIAGDSQIPWTQNFMLENLCMEERQVGFLHSEFNLPSWSLDPLSPSSCFYNEVYCDILFNFPEKRGTTHFEEPFFWF